MLIDFGVAEHVEATAVGHPGQRIFFLRLLGEVDHSAALKLEKQHLIGLGAALAELLDQSGFQGSPRTAGVANFPTTAEYEFRVGQLGVGYLREEGRIALEARDVNAENVPDVAIIRVRFAPDQGAVLIQQLRDLVQSGRPVCPLCGQGIDPEGHACPHSNGHSQQPIPDERRDDEE